jgi:hypothetical protein
MHNNENLTRVKPGISSCYKFSGYPFYSFDVAIGAHVADMTVYQKAKIFVSIRACVLKLQPVNVRIRGYKSCIYSFYFQVRAALTLPYFFDSSRFFIIFSICVYPCVSVAKILISSFRLENNNP